MYPESVIILIKDVFTSWQVIAVTIGIIIYLNIVFYVARFYRTPKVGSLVKKISFKRKKKEDAVGGAVEEAGSGTKDELGLEEA